MELFPHLPENKTAFGPGQPEGWRKRIAEPDAPVALGRLHNRSAPLNHVISEQPWHTVAAQHFATGVYNARQISGMCGHGYNTVLNLLRQPWFQQKVELYQREFCGAQDVMAMFRAEVVPSLVTLIELRDNPETPASVARACATDIIHQVIGKPTMKVETTEIVHSEDPVAEVARLEAENIRLVEAARSSETNVSLL